jgi:hypothetical protein
MRGMVVGGDDKLLYPNTSDAEQQSTRFVPSATGFQVNSTNAFVNASGGNYIYIAIRRGPMGIPESASEVFDIATRDATHPSFDASFDTVDFSFVKNSATTGSWRVTSRLQGANVLYSDTTAAEAAYSPIEWDYMDGWSYDVGTASTFYSWMWRRAPSFFDAVAYSGNSTAGRTVSHSLGVAPEMMWIKARNSSENWAVYHADQGNTKEARLNQTSAFGTSTTHWNSTSPTDSVFTLGASAAVNGSGKTYIAYLFASLNGVSKVGSYTGNGTSQNIDCGFSSGARFVLIKAASTSGNWILFDSERGIVAGNDPFLVLNTTGAESSAGDYIDPYSAGFTLPSATLNTSGVEWIFYAIA